MKVKFITCLIVLGTLLLLNACGGNKPSENNVDIDAYNYVQFIPDSLRTPKQQKIYDLLLQILVEHLQVKDNVMFLDVDEKYFESMGVPVEYYSWWIRDLENNNKFFQEHNIDSVAVLLEEAKQSTLIGQDFSKE